jgi:hypothetical protein
MWDSILDLPLAHNRSLGGQRPSPNLSHVFSKTELVPLPSSVCRTVGRVTPGDNGCEGPCKHKEFYLLKGRKEQRPKEALRLRCPVTHTNANF